MNAAALAIPLIVMLLGIVVAVAPGKPSTAPLNRFAQLGVCAFFVGLFYVLAAVHVLRLGP